PARALVARGGPGGMLLRRAHFTLRKASTRAGPARLIEHRVGHHKDDNGHDLYANPRLPHRGAHLSRHDRRRFHPVSQLHAVLGLSTPAGEGGAATRVPHTHLTRRPTMTSEKSPPPDADRILEESIASV